MKTTNYRKYTQAALFLLIAIILTASIIAVSGSFVSASKVNKSLERHISTSKRISESLDLQSYMSELVLAANSIFKTGDLKRERKRENQSFQKFKSSAEQLESDIEKTYEGTGTQDLVKLVSSVRVIAGDMHETAEQIFKHFENGDIPSARLLGEKISKQHLDAEITIHEAIDSMLFRQKELLNTTSSSINSQRTLFLLIFCVAIILGIVLLLWELKQAHDVDKLLQLHKKETREAVSASKSKNNFLSNLTHQVRTSLNTIIGFGEVLRKTELSHDQREYLRNISNSADDLLSVVNDVLDLSKIESGNMVIESIPFRLDYVVQSIVDQVRIRTNNRDVEITTEAAPDVPMWFLGDPTRIRQILLNLLTNAAKFTVKGSIVIKVTGKIQDGQTGLKQPVRLIKIDVVDTGCGIPQHKLNHMFKALDNDSSSSGYGEAGIGISATKKIAELMKGALTGVSEPGKGSTFTVILPLKESGGNQQSAPVPADMNHLKNQKLIVVDADSTTQSLISEFALDLGMQITGKFSSSSELAESSDVSEEVNLVLLDLNSISENAKTVIESLQSKPAMKKAQFVAMCLNAIPGSAFKAESAGFDSFISKPLLRRDLIKVLLMTIGDKGNTHGRILTKHNFDEIQLTKMNIVVAEDNPVTQLLNQEIFKNLGCSFTQVSNGEDLIKEIATGKYDACVTDIDMPKLNGLEAAKKIRVELKSKIPIIAVTAAVMNNELEMAMHSGVNEIMAKPIQVDKLRAILINYSITVEAPAR